MNAPMRPAGRPVAVEQQPLPPAEMPDFDTLTVVLSRKIVTRAGEVTKINLREPTFTDYIALGDIDTPVASDFVDGRATVLKTHTDRDALVGWAVALSGLDRIVLGQLSARDAGALFEAVRMAVEPFAKGNSSRASTNSSSSSGSTPGSSSAHR